MVSSAPHHLRKIRGEFRGENNSLSCCFCKLYKHTTGQHELDGGLKLKLHGLMVNPAEAILNVSLARGDPLSLDLA